MLIFTVITHAFWHMQFFVCIVKIKPVPEKKHRCVEIQLIINSWTHKIHYICYIVKFCVVYTTKNSKFTIKYDGVQLNTRIWYLLSSLPISESRCFPNELYSCTPSLLPTLSPNPPCLHPTHFHLGQIFVPRVNVQRLAWNVKLFISFLINHFCSN